MNSRLQGIIITALAMVVILSIKFNKLILDLNGYLFNAHTDGFKSYFNFAYYLRYGSGLKHDAINYPYGDHIHFINSHPLYLYIHNLLGDWSPFADYGVGVINGLMLLSMVIAAPVLYLLLRSFKLPQWFAICFALLIQLCYPQFERLNGHYEMVIAFVIPLHWYFLIQFRKGKWLWGWGTLIVVHTILVGMIGAYLAAFCSIFTMAIVGFEAFLERKRIRAYLVPGGRLLLTAVLPLLFLKIYTDVTDWAIDRPTDPWGFFTFNANPLSIFLPDSSILKSILLPRMYDYAVEGRAYVGLIATFLALSMILYFIYALFKKRKLDLSPFNLGREWTIYLTAAFIVLLYSMSWPFDWGLKWVVDEVAILKQFRALGRFAWVFYYVFTVYTACFIYQLYQKIRGSGYDFVAFLLLVFVLCQWTFDAGVNLKKSNFDRISKNTLLNYQDTAFLDYFEGTNYKPSDFQAILAIPFSQTNGDKMLFHKGDQALKTAMSFAYHTGLPLVQSFSPRLSFSNSLTSIQLFGNPCIRKERLDDMTEKPILVISTKDRKRRPEELLLAKTKQLVEKDNIRLSLLDLNTFTNDYQACQNRYRTWVDSLHDDTKIHSTGRKDLVVYEDFETLDNNESDVALSGSKAYYHKKGNHIVFEKQLTNYRKGQKATFSFWLYFDKTHHGLAGTFFEELDQSGKVVRSSYLYMRETHDVQYPWIRGNFTFDVDPDHTYRLRADGKKVRIDDILIKPVEDDVLIRQTQVDLFNNFVFNK